MMAISKLLRAKLKTIKFSDPDTRSIPGTWVLEVGIRGDDTVLPRCQGCLLAMTLQDNLETTIRTNRKVA